MIEITTTDLKEHLQQIDNKLHTPSLQGARISDEEAAERQRMQEERESTQQCLDICAEVSLHIDQVQPNTLQNISTPSDTHHRPVTLPWTSLPASLVTANTLKECKERLKNTISQLERHLQDINKGLQNVSSQSLDASDEQVAEQERIQEEVESIKQCLVICDRAAEQADRAFQDRTNAFEDVSMTDDGQQVIVSTFGDLISAKRVTAGARSAQWLGQMSDDTLQQLSRDHRHSAVEKNEEPKPGTGPQFEGRYGSGHKLSE
jgi:hypothetical protein